MLRCALVLLFIVISTYSTTYYVNFNVGSNNNAGTSERDAWKDLDEVNRRMSGFLPGDTVLFNRGDVFPGPIYMEYVAGTADNVITFGAYGTGAKPIIDGSIGPPRSWVREGVGTDHTYSLTLDQPGDYDYEIRRVIVNGKIVEVSSFPDKGTYINMPQESDNMGSLYMDTALYTLTSDQVVGARLGIRGNRWVYWAADVDAYNPTTGLGWGFFMTNKLWMIKENTFVWDAVNEKLYLWAAGNADPNTLDIRYSYVDKGICVHHSQHIVIEDLHLRYHNDYGFDIEWSNHTTIQNCEITGVSNIAINVGYRNPGGYLKFLHNRIVDSGVRGIHCTNWEDNANNYDVIGNYIENVFDNPYNTLIDVGDVLHWQQKGTGIYVDGESMRVEYNEIHNVGYAGISSCQGNFNTIKYNYVTNCAMWLDDVAGIYVCFSTNGVIKNNILDSCPGSVWGVGNNAWDGQPPATYSMGLYLDDGNTDCVVENNLAKDVDVGVLIHNTGYSTIRNNILFGCRELGLYFSEDSIYDVPGFTANNIVEDNIFYINSHTAYLVQISGNLGHLDVASSIDRNLYWRRSFGSEEFYVHSDVLGSWVWYDNLEDWGRIAGYDIHSRYIADWFHVGVVGTDDTGSDINIVYETDLITNPSFDENIDGWWLDGYEAAFITTTWLQPWNTNCLKGGIHGDNHGGCLSSTSSRSVRTTADILFAPDYQFQIKQGQEYQLRISIKSDLVDEIPVNVRKDGDDSASLGYSKSIQLPTPNEWVEVIDYFTGTMDYAAATLQVHSGETEGATYHFDEIHLYEVTITSPTKTTGGEEEDGAGESEPFTVLYNPTNSSTTVDYLVSIYCNEDDGSDVTSVTLGRYESQFVVNCYCNQDGICNNKEDSVSCPEDCGPAMEDTPGDTVDGLCGNDVCDDGEDEISCPQDCEVVVGGSSRVRNTMLFTVCIFCTLITWFL